MYINARSSCLVLNIALKKWDEFSTVFSIVPLVGLEQVYLIVLWVYLPT